MGKRKVKASTKSEASNGEARSGEARSGGSHTKKAKTATSQKRNAGKDQNTSSSSKPQELTHSAETSGRISSRGELRFTTPEDLLTSMLSPATSLASFFADYWEKKPLVVHRGRNQTLTNYYGIDFTKETLLTILSDHRVEFGRDVNVCRYVDSVRQNLNGNGRATAGKIKNLFDQKKATLQFHQPQRFQDELWHVCEFLESYFHSLVGANIYMTPGGSQGLAPHYDDVEVLILQLAGRKHWRLYSPPVDLPRDYSRDLNQDDVGKPTHDFILETGDLLYFPRGTVHQADTPDDCPYSAHVTISTYQRSSYGDILGIALPHILNSAVKDSLDFRKGLPTSFLTHNRTEDKSTIDHLIGQLSNHVGDQVQQAANQMMCDVVANRLPPYRRDSHESGPVGLMPTDSCRVRLTHPRHTFVALVSECKDGDGDDEEEEEEDDGEDDEHEEEEADSDGDKKMVVVRHSLNNSREEHMMNTGGQEANGLQFPAEFHQALTQLMESTDWLDGTDLRLPQDDIKHLLVSLWSEGLLEVCDEQ